MTQDAIVIRTLPGKMAEVLVARQTACGSNCGSCEACVFQSELRAVAKNRIDAKPGQKVVISSRNSAVFSAAAMVYIMPLVLFLLGYVLANALGASEGICILVSFVFLCCSAVILVQFHKKQKEENKIQFDIVS